MSNPHPLTARETLELLSRLKEMLAQLAAQESRSLGEVQKRELAMKRQYRDAATRAQMADEARREHEEQAWQEWQNQFHAAHAARRTRIQGAYQRSLKNLQAQAERARQKYLGDLQMRHFQAERQKPEQLKRLEQTYAEATAQLASKHKALLHLAQRFRYALRKYGSLRKRLVGGLVPVTARHIAPLDEQLIALESKVTGFEALYSDAGLRKPIYWIAGGSVVLVGLAATAFYVLRHSLPLWVVAFVFPVGVLLVIVAAVLAWRRAKVQHATPPAAALTQDLAQAQTSYEAEGGEAKARHDQALVEFEDHFEREFGEIAQQWDLADEVARRFSKTHREKLERQVLHLLGRHDRSLEPREARARVDRSSRERLALAQSEAAQAEQKAAHAMEISRLEEEKVQRWTPLAQRWHDEVLPLLRQMEGARAAADTSPGFDEAAHRQVWSPPKDFTNAITIGRLMLDLRSPGASPLDERLQLPGRQTVDLPLNLVFPEQGSVLFETAGSGETFVTGALNSLILQLFGAVPAGKLSVTLIDPVGLGQNFAGLMTLGDYEESLINRRIWTQREQIDERLAELNEHIEKMIQMYLRDEFATITQYNEQAGSVAEKYHLLVVADFPAGFSETAAKRLHSIAVSGPRCGVFTLIHRDTRQPIPEGLVPAELRERSICIQRLPGSEYGIDPAQNRSRATLQLGAPLPAAQATALVHQIGRASAESNRVEVPFSQIAPAAGDLWKSDTSAELRVPIGRTGATKLQYLAIGKGTRQHALFAGKTGSGKSTLFHVIITNLALWCSPQEVEFYLIDFKKGVEFKCYATHRLPHARVVAIESDREFALSVLQRVDEELRRRGDLFRALGAQDLAGYKRNGGLEAMPRSLLIIDEFQEFFVEDDAVAQGAALLFDRIVRQGRAFGIHVLLGSQTLGGAYTLARATLGQMVIRVALQCNEADAYLIMDENNAAPRLLSRPGEGIYNDAAGAVEGNSPFQVVWLSDEERDRRLEEIRVLAGKGDFPVRTPVVFEGNTPAAIRDNDLLGTLLVHQAEQMPHEGRIWLGAPNAIKGPTEVRFRRQSGNHLVIVGQRDEAAVSMLGLGLIALGAQYPAGTLRLYLFTTAPDGSAEMEFLNSAVAATQHPVTVVRGTELNHAMAALSAELKSRTGEEEAGGESPATYVFIHGLQRFKKLKFEDDFSFSTSTDEEANPGAQLNDIISEGASAGIHLVISLDTFANLQRWLNRKAIGEFEFRVLFQMSANDSASLIDSPQASSLGLYRALLYNEQEGTTETFRPYALPEKGWLEKHAIGRQPAALTQQVG